MKSNDQAREIKKRIRDLSFSKQVSFSQNQLRVIVALERLVARLEAHPLLSRHLIFKGGFALLKHIESNRFTHDLDASYFQYPLDDLEPVISAAILADIQDGMWFGDVKNERILVDTEYSGTRFNCAFQIGDPPNTESKLKKLSRVHFDIGLSDIKLPALQKVEMPSLLPTAQAVSWFVFPVEQIFAEKLETFIKRGPNNSRGKDIYDMVNIFPRCKSIKDLKVAIELIFTVRKTPLPKSFVSVAQQTNQIVLRASWSSIVLPEPKCSFDDTWKKFADFLAILDEEL